MKKKKAMHSHEKNGLYAKCGIEKYLNTVYSVRNILPFVFGQRIALEIKCVLKKMHLHFCMPKRREKSLKFVKRNVRIQCENVNYNYCNYQFSFD